MNDVAQSPDARVRSAISHWAPRFVANGVTLTDFEEVTAATPIMERLVPRLVGARCRS